MYPSATSTTYPVRPVARRPVPSTLTGAAPREPEPGAIPPPGQQPGQQPASPLDRRPVVLFRSIAITVSTTAPHERELARVTAPHQPLRKRKINAISQPAPVIAPATPPDAKYRRGDDSTDATDLNDSTDWADSTEWDWNDSKRPPAEPIHASAGRAWLLAPEVTGMDKLARLWALPVPENATRHMEELSATCRDVCASLPIAQRLDVLHFLTSFDCTFLRTGEDWNAMIARSMTLGQHLGWNRHCHGDLLLQLFTRPLPDNGTLRARDYWQTGALIAGVRKSLPVRKYGDLLDLLMQVPLPAPAPATALARRHTISLCCMAFSATFHGMPLTSRTTELARLMAHDLPVLDPARHDTLTRLTIATDQCYGEATEQECRGRINVMTLDTDLPVERVARSSVLARMNAEFAGLYRSLDRRGARMGAELYSASLARPIDTVGRPRIQTDVRAIREVRVAAISPYLPTVVPPLPPPPPPRTRRLQLP